MKEALAARMRFYRDLGLTEFYRRPVEIDASESVVGPELSSIVLPTSQNRDVGHPNLDVLGSPTLATEPRRKDGARELIDSDGVQEREDESIPPRKPIFAPSVVGDSVAAADRAAALRLIQEEIGPCTRCALHKGRNKIVFGDGSADARLMFVGEGPGADEDAQGLPFVGKAGQLLNNMIAAMGLKREEVYIANVVKCRPPGNRTPEPEEANTCSPFLFRQIDVIRPEVLVALGATAATYLLGQRQPLAGLRGRVHTWRGSKLIVTYHPAFLLRDPRQKKEAWADLQIAMRELGLSPPSRG